jgi:hypothetical protein
MVALHFRVVLEPLHCVLKHARGFCIWRIDNSIMHPLTCTSRIDDSGAAQISQVAAYFWLVRLKDFDEETDTHFVRPHQIQQSQPRTIRERPKK